MILGDAGAGKTSLALRFAEGCFRTFGSTCGAFFVTKRIQTKTGITCKVQIWDTAGKQEFRAMAPMYYKQAAAAIICYDQTRQDSYDIMRGWLDELHLNVQAGSIVLAIAATKADLGEGVVPVKEVEEYAQRSGAIYVLTSAKDNTGITELFERVTDRVLRFRRDKSCGIPVTPGAIRNKDDKDDISEDSPERIASMQVDNWTPTKARRIVTTRSLFENDGDSMTASPVSDDHSKRGIGRNNDFDQSPLHKNYAAKRAEPKRFIEELSMCDFVPCACDTYLDRRINSEEDLVRKDKESSRKEKLSCIVS